MPRAASFAGVILAAGESSRMGRDKALLPWPPASPNREASTETFLSAAIRLFLQTADFVLVVAGKNASVLAPVVYAQGASLVVNPDASRGQFSSLQAGLGEVLNRGRDAAMITLIDRPPVKASTIHRLHRAFEASANSIWTVVPEYAGKHGHPYLVSREMIEEFLRVPPTSTARDIEHQHLAHIQYVSVDDPLVVANVNTPEDYAGLAPAPS